MIEPTPLVTNFRNHNEVAQMDDPEKPGTFTQWNCDCGKTTTSARKELNVAKVYTVNIYRKVIGIV